MAAAGSLALREICHGKMMNKDERIIDSHFIRLILRESV
jgi:hypothetical protein